MLVGVREGIQALKFFCQIINISVLSKFSCSSGVNHPAHGRVGLNGWGPIRSSICEIPRREQKQINALRIGSLNVVTLRGRSSEVVETMSRRD